MARVRKVRIQNFRGIRDLEWSPNPGINALIGPGDSGKSTILDAIDLCLGARRYIQFTDDDFYCRNIGDPIIIEVTFGDLDDTLKDFEKYGAYLRGLKPDGTLEEEPSSSSGLETVLTLQLTVDSELEPVWNLVRGSEETGIPAKSLRWSDRVKLAPSRIGASSHLHLSWKKSSVLNKLSNEGAEMDSTLLKVVREMRTSLGTLPSGQLKEALSAVHRTAMDLGIPVGDQVHAMLDAETIGLNNGAMALHDANEIPLRRMGIGSTRLLIAGLQHRVTAGSKIVLIDELEHGLEPHRIIRLLHSLGSREKSPPLQVFVTTHSPIVVRELSAKQLYVVRQTDRGMVRLRHAVEASGNVQGALRAIPEAFLSRTVLLCEGQTEVGMMRGLDLYRVEKQESPLAAQGVAIVSYDGGGRNRCLEYGNTLIDLGYYVGILRDDDKPPCPQREASFIRAGGKVFTWEEGRETEKELFMSLSDTAVLALVEAAVEIHGKNLINEHIRSKSDNTLSLDSVLDWLNIFDDTFDNKMRNLLANCAGNNSTPWFKSISIMEPVARDIIGPTLDQSLGNFAVKIEEIAKWAESNAL